MLRFLLVGATTLGGVWAFALPGSTPAGAQFFPFFGPYQPRVIEQPREQEADYSRAPAPKKSDTPPTTTIVVMGDSMADWLAYGLEQAYEDTPEIGVVRKNKPFSGLIRYEAKGSLDWQHVARDNLATENPAAVVMIIGLSDRRSLQDTPDAKDPQAANPDQAAENPDQKNAAADAKRGKTSRYDYRSDGWAEQYSKLIDQTIAAMKSKGVPVLWVGLPAVCCAKSTSDTAYLNDLYRAEAEKNGIIYVDAWDGFVDESGKYTSYGPDVEGQRRRLRTPDGVYFTDAGARKLAHYVERELSRVMSVHSMPVSLPADGMPLPGGQAPGQPRPAAGPVLPLTATPASSSETLVGGGAVRAGTTDPAAARVLVKGEPVAPLKGRADDFAWSPAGSDAAPASPADQSANAKPDAAPEKAPAPAAAPPAAKTDASKKPPSNAKQTDQADQQKNPAAENSGKQGGETPPPQRKRRSGTTASDVPRPPAAIGRSSNSVPFNWFR